MNDTAKLISETFIPAQPGYSTVDFNVVYVKSQILKAYSTSTGFPYEPQLHPSKCVQKMPVLAWKVQLFQGNDGRTFHVVKPVPLADEPYEPGCTAILTPDGRVEEMEAVPTNPEGDDFERPSYPSVADFVQSKVEELRQEQERIEGHTADECEGLDHECEGLEAGEELVDLTKIFAKEAAAQARGVRRAPKSRKGKAVRPQANGTRHAAR